MPKSTPPQKPLRQRLDEHAGLIILSVVIATATITWSVADSVMLKIKDNEIADLNKQIVELNKQLNAATATPTPKSTAAATIPSAAPVQSTPRERLPSPLPTPATTEDLGLTLEQLDGKFKALNGNRGQERILIYTVANQRVHWRVKVSSVSYYSESVTAAFGPVAGPSSDFVWLADFDGKFKKRFLSLPENAVIIIHGILKPISDGTWLRVNAEAFDVDK